MNTWAKDILDGLEKEYFYDICHLFISNSTIRILAKSKQEAKKKYLVKKNIYTSLFVVVKRVYPTIGEKK